MNAQAVLSLYTLPQEFVQLQKFHDCTLQHLDASKVHPQDFLQARDYLFPHQRLEYLPGSTALRCLQGGINPEGPASKDSTTAY